MELTEMKDRIKYVRKELGLTQQDFASRIGINRGSLAHYEVGDTKPLDTVCMSMCKEFSINEEWLKTGFGEPFTEEDMRDAEIAAWVGRVLADRESSVQKRMLEVLSKLSPAEWRVLEKKCREIVGEEVDPEEET